MLFRRITEEPVLFLICIFIFSSAKMCIFIIIMDKAAIWGPFGAKITKLLHKHG